MEADWLTLGAVARQRTYGYTVEVHGRLPKRLEDAPVRRCTEQAPSHSREDGGSGGRKGSVTVANLRQVAAGAGVVRGLQSKRATKDCCRVIDLAKVDCPSECTA